MIFMPIFSIIFIFLHVYADNAAATATTATTTATVLATAPNYDYEYNEYYQQQHHLDQQYRFDRDDGYIPNDVMECSGHKSHYWDHWYADINDDACSFRSGAEHCVYDFTGDASNGAFDAARARCTGDEGHLYMYDALITCPDGSSYTFASDVLECYSGCDPRSAEYTIKYQYTADFFLTANLNFKNKKGCSWESMDVYYDITDAVTEGTKDECDVDDCVQFANDYASIANDYVQIGNDTIAALSGVENTRIKSA